MDFLRARTKEQITNRQQEIIQACAVLYEKGGYDGVNFKAVSELTSFTRSSIYNYYKTKDEVLLDLLGQDIEVFQQELTGMIHQDSMLSKKEFANQLTQTLAVHDRMLKLWSILFTVLEHNCCVEKLAEFKKNVLGILATLSQIIKTHFPTANEEQIQSFVFELLSFVLGLYPMSHMTRKQNEAIVMSGVAYQAPEFTSMCSKGIYLLLSEL